MKFGAFTALHYGSDYLGYAMRSVAQIGLIDLWIVAYSSTGSHGTPSMMPCSDSEDELKAIAVDALSGTGAELLWYSGDWKVEGEQRDWGAAAAKANDIELYLVVDADEVWHDAGVKEALRLGSRMTDRFGHVAFRHFWRSFNWIAVDAAMPIRLIRPFIDDGHVDLPLMSINHFGYARMPEDTRYKVHIHGHKGEWRNGWLEDTFLSWSPVSGPFEDVHPTNKDFWSLKPFDKRALPDIMKDHPYYDMEIIR